MMNHPRHSEKGFTLMEAMIALAILAIAVSIAVPSMTQLAARKQVESAVAEIAQAFNLARSEAVARNTPMTVCPSAGGSCGASWAGGALVFVDLNRDGSQDGGEDSVEESVTDFSRLTFTTNNYANGVTYLADGSVLNNGSITICNDYNFGMQLVINAVGRPRLEEASASC